MPKRDREDRPSDVLNGEDSPRKGSRPDEEGKGGVAVKAEGETTGNSAEDRQIEDRSGHGASVGMDQGANGAARQGVRQERAEDDDDDDDRRRYDDDDDDDDDDDGDAYIALPKSSSKAALKKGSECPYLDTVSRQVGVVVQGG
jgi:hypothetical protein